MFISIDEHGKVVLSTVTKVMIVMKSSKLVLYNPKKKEGSGFKFNVVACRFL